MDLKKQLSELIEVNKQNHIKKISYVSDRGESLDVEFNAPIIESNNDSSKRSEEVFEPSFASQELAIKKKFFGEQQVKTDFNTPLE